MQRMFKALAFVSVCLCMSVTALVAEELSEMSLNDLLNMKVTVASKKAESLNEAAAVVSVVTAQEIQQFGALNLHEILNRVCDVYVIGNYLHPQGNTSIRGDLATIIDNHILLLMNGRPMREGSTGGWNNPVYNVFPIDLIDHIEIIRGPGSVLYGTNAYVGVINIVTKKPAAETAGSITAGGGSFATGFGSALIGKEVNKDFSFIASAKYFRTYGWDFTMTDEGFPTRTPSTPLSKTIQMADLQYGLGGVMTYKNLTLNLFVAHDSYNSVGSLPVWNNPNKIASAGDPNANDFDRIFFDLGYKLDINTNWYATANLTCNYNLMILENDPTSHHESADYLGEVTFFGKMFADKLNLIVGGVVNKITEPNQGDQIRFIPPYQYTYPILRYDLTQQSAYAQATYDVFSLLKAVAGAQTIWPYTGNSVTVPRFGLVANYEGYGAKALYSEAYRSPYPIETQINSPSLRGNPNIDPEKIATYDFQVSRNGQKYQMSVGYFQSKYTNIIARTGVNNVFPGDAFPNRLTYINAGELKTHGFEFEGKVYPMSHMYILGSYSYQTSEQTLLVNGILGEVNDVTFVPNHMAKAGVAYDIPGVTFGLFDEYFSRPNSIAAVNPAVKMVNPMPDCYHWLTLNVTFDLSKLARMNYKGLSLSLYGENLLNQNVYYPEFGRKNIDSIPALPGISFYAQVNCKL